MNELISFGRHTHVPEDVSTHVPISLGSFCSIASGLTVVSGQHPGVANPKAISDFPFAEHGWAGEYPASDMGEGVKVGSDVWIGQGVTIMDRVVVGHGARIAACSVVTRDVPPYWIVGGNPAEIIRSRFESRRVAELLGIEWWRWDDVRISKALKDFTDVDRFIAEYRSE